MPAPLGPWQPEQAGIAALGDAAAIDLLAERDEVLVLREAGLGLLAGVEGGDVLHVGLAQRRRHRLHDRVVALAGLELGELLDEVVGVLALDDRVGGDCRASRRWCGRRRRPRPRSPRPWPAPARSRRSRRRAKRRRPRKRRASEQSKRDTGFMRRAVFSCQSQRFYNERFTATSSTSMPTSAARPQAAGDDDADATHGARLGAHRALSHHRERARRAARRPSCPRSPSSAARMPASRRRSTS